MKISKRMQAVAWGFNVGALFTAGWFWWSSSDGRGEPMLLPGQSRSTVALSELRTGTLIFFGTGVPVALLVALRPSKRGKDKH